MGKVSCKFIKYFSNFVLKLSVKFVYKFPKKAEQIPKNFVGTYIYEILEKYRKIISNHLMNFKISLKRKNFREIEKKFWQNLKNIFKKRWIFF